MVMLTKDGAHYSSTVDGFDGEQEVGSKISSAVRNLFRSTKTAPDDEAGGGAKVDRQRQANLAAGVGGSTLDDEPIEGEPGCCGTLGFVSIMHPGSRMFYRWKVFMLVAVVVHCFTVPFLVAFRIDYDRAGPWVLMYLADLAYWMDIVVNFRTACVVQDVHHAMLVFDGRYIARKYMAGTFKWDLLAVFPFELIAVFIGDAYLLPFFRINRLFHFPALLSHFKRQENDLQVDTGSIRTNKFSIIIVCTIHTITCGWWLIACRSTLHEDEADFSCSDPSWATSLDIDQQSVYEQYVSS